MEPLQTRMRKSTDAVIKAKDDPNVFLAIGKIFWAENKPIKARKFLQKSVELDKDFADAWLYLIEFEKEFDKSVVEKLKS